jgi:hypothetical protein
MIADYPSEVDAWTNAAAEAQMEIVKEAIHGARSVFFSSAHFCFTINENRSTKTKYGIINERYSISVFILDRCVPTTA